MKNLRKIAIGSALVANLLVAECKNEENIESLPLRLSGFDKIEQVSYHEFPSLPFENDGIFRTEEGNYIIRNGYLLYFINDKGRLMNYGSDRITKQEDGKIIFERLGQPDFRNPKNHENLRTRQMGWAIEAFEQRDSALYVKGWRR